MTTATPRRRLRLTVVLLTGIAIPVALLTLMTLEPVPALPEGINNAAKSIGQILIQVVSVSAAIAVILGVLNLFRVHIANLTKLPRGIYSLFTLLTMIAVLVIRLLERLNMLKIGGSDAPVLTPILIDTLQVVVESALAGLLFFFLVYAAYRLMRRRVTIWNALFIFGLVIVLLGYDPLFGLESLSGLRDWLLRVPVGAGMRGLLIGVAIGTVVVGIRVLIGQDRTFRE